MGNIVVPALIMGLLGLGFGLSLAWLAKKMAVAENPLVQKVAEILPGANCGACGYPGCAGLAEKIVSGEALVNACPVGEIRVWQEIARILGNSEKLHFETKKAVLLCQGGKGIASEISRYHGVQDCKAVALLGNVPRICRFGCLGFGNCERVCPFSAIRMDSETGLPQIMVAKCTGCGKCVAECPRKVLALVPYKELVLCTCTSKDPGKVVRQACSRGCIKCQICVRTCPEKAITLEGERIQIDPEKCTLCGLCIEKCPTQCLVRFFQQSPVSQEPLEVS
ncbi:MAG: RnfABCDGE type electron transport complex subunit B [Candidatus Caldatribacteriaceae bacterium]